MSVLSEYLQLFAKYKEKYGESTALIMQVGSFYEMYGVDNKKEKLGNAIELSKVLNIVLTRKNKKISDNNVANPLMLGFPCLALNKYVPILLENNYTIVVVDQIKTPLSIKRVVTNVISPSTYIDSINTWKDEYLAIIYINKIRNDIHIGLSAISILTGNSIVYECYSLPDDKDASLDDAVSFIKKYKPREAVVASNAGEIDKDFACLGGQLEFSHYRSINNIVHNVEYQNAVLGNVFKHKTMLSNIEYIDLERSPYALISYVLLIEFVYDHNPMLLKKISPPSVYVPSQQLILATNTIDQLNITKLVKKNDKHSLFGIINRCSTSMGKRFLLKRLLNPIFDVKKLEERYQQISDMANQDIKAIENILNDIFDIEKLQRKMSIGIITPNELHSLISSYEALLELDDLLKTSKFSVVLTDEEVSVLKEFLSVCDRVFIIENMQVWQSIGSSNLHDKKMFKNNVFKEIDELYEEINKEMDKIIKCSNDILEPVKIEYMQNVGYYLTISNAKAKKIYPNVGHTYKSNKSNTRITNSVIDNANKKINDIHNILKSRLQKCYGGVIRYIIEYYGSCFSKFVLFVSQVDVIKSLYIISTLYNYCRPRLLKPPAASFIDAKNLRHPIIERLDNSTEYVPNDLIIGKDYNGIILYSMNACGKTSLLKACGLSVILAQMGCYVPASSYTFYPFKCIMSRIISEDNMVKGQSSFVAEMSELRAILKRANDSSTLVLADEITHGTEHTSGSSIFISCVETLAKRKVNFMFTTHLHNVHPFVCKISNVKIFHLSVKFDRYIIFERKLLDGPGDSIYGLEVCQFLNMDADFLARAFQIRKQINPQTNIIKLSKYNSNKSVNHCEICEYSPKAETDMPLDVHHIKKQRIADCNGIIGNIHKNAKSNLVTLCKQCHNKVHKSEITISGYIFTTQGTKLIC